MPQVLCQPGEASHQVLRCILQRLVWSHVVCAVTWSRLVAVLEATQSTAYPSLHAANHSTILAALAMRADGCLLPVVSVWASKAE